MAPMRATVAWTTIGIVVTVAAAQAQTSPAATVSVPRLAAAPAIDGTIGESEWQGANAIELAYQTQPGDNASASERTDVLLGHDTERLYIAFRAHDTEAAAIRGRVTRRDDIFGDDYVTLHLDTYDDRRRAYVFLQSARHPGRRAL